jgi:hypothetical protein
VRRRERRAGGRLAGLLLSNDDELPLRDDYVELFCPDCAVREFDGD